MYAGLFIARLTYVVVCVGVKRAVGYYLFEQRFNYVRALLLIVVVMKVVMQSVKDEL